MKQTGMILGLLMTAALTGCGGGNRGPGAVATIASPFAGHWSGTWTDASGDDGTVDLTTGTDGRMTGTLIDQTAGLSGSLTGRVTPTGQLTQSVVYPGVGTITLTGTLTMGSGNTATGNVQEAVSGRTSSSAAFLLTRQG